MRDGDQGVLGGGTAWRTTLLILLLTLGALTLAALILTQVGANRQRDEALRAQEHSYDVMVLARTLSGTIAQSEASLGRYVISGDRQLGQLYFDQWTLAGTQIDRLDRLVADNAYQQRQIDRLRAAYRARGEELSLTALTISYGRNSQALARYYQTARAPSLVAINRLLERITLVERALLDRRSRIAVHSVDQSNRIAGGLAAFGTLLILAAIVLGWLTVNAVGARAEAEARADSERDRAEELGRAVEAATAELRTQEAKLRQVQKMQAVGQLTGGIAHDFNNMLAVVLGGLELAERHVGTDPDRARRHLDQAHDGAERAAALTRRLLAFSREEALKPDLLRLDAVVSGMADLLAPTLGDAIELAVRGTVGDWTVLADRVQMENAILNLAVNARDAMDGRGTLTITLGRASLPGDGRGSGDAVVLSVADTGCGMTPEVAERVFEPFFTTKDAGRGTGLGLSQIFTFVDQLGGWIGIDSVPGRGTTVTLHVPRHAGETGAAAPADMAPQPPAAAGGRLRVLVVEDDPRVLAATTGALEELGHDPVACPDPLAAPAMLDADPTIGLIISDVLMPRQTGPEMIAALPPHLARLPVLFVTGFAGDVAASALDGRHVLRKPFTLAKLERAIADVVDPGQSHQLAAA